MYTIIICTNFLQYVFPAPLVRIFLFFSFFFLRFFCETFFCLKILRTVWGYLCSNHTAAGEVCTVLVQLPSRLSRYCHFGETVLMPSRVVSTIYVCVRRYAAITLMAITCVQTSLVSFSRRHSAARMGRFIETTKSLTRSHLRTKDSVLLATFRALSP